MDVITLHIEPPEYAGLMHTITAPIRAVAYCSSTHSAQLGAQMPTRSPLITPLAIIARAT